MDVGHCTRIALSLHNKSTKWLASRMGVSPAMAGYHKRESRQGMTSVIKLAEAFDMSVTEFLELQNMKERD